MLPLIFLIMDILKDMGVYEGISTYLRYMKVYECLGRFEANHKRSDKAVNRLEQCRTDIQKSPSTIIQIIVGLSSSIKLFHLVVSSNI